MAVVVDASDVIVRIDRLADGLDAFARSVPNATFCTDGRIARASFMHSGDRDAFASKLAPAAVARVTTRGIEGDCEWLAFGQYAGVVAVWLVGGSPEPLVVPIGWRPDAIRFVSNDELQHFEYLGAENGVEVYRDKRTGEKKYMGRTQPSIDPAEAKELERVRQEASEMVKPFILGPPRDLGFFDKRRVRKGMALLQKVLDKFPDHWSTLWLFGMSARALREHAKAIEALRRAYEANPNQPDVGREYAAQCLIVGDGEEGVRVSRAVHARFPDDIGLHSNLALALFIGGDLGEALKVAKAAHARDKRDPITAHLLDAIRDVRAGRRPRPKKMPGY